MMARLGSFRIFRCAILIGYLAVLLPGFSWAAGGDGEADFCPGTPERPTAFDPACRAGFLQMNGCADVGATGCGEPQTNGITCNNTNSCWAIPPCGGLGERACCSGSECEAGLSQYFVDPDSFGLCDDYAGGCLCEAPNQNTEVTSNGYCQAITACGGPGERACCPGEPERPGVGDPACEAGLVEQLGCFGPGCGCSSSTCRAPTACGGAGQRACCPGEPGRPTSADFACPNGDNLREVAADPDPALFCGLNADVLTNSVCEAVEPCGGEGQRACCFGTDERLATGGCEAGLVEAPGCDGIFSDCTCGGTDSIISSFNNQSSGTCIQESSCGGIGERGCCLGAERLPTGACEAGLTEVPNGCTGNCYCGANDLGNGALSSSTCISLDPPHFPIDEPGTDCTPGSPGCPLRGYADMHVHMFGHLAHGGAAFVGKPFDAQGGVNAALRQDAWTPAEIEYDGALRAVIDKYGDPVAALNEGQCNDMNVLSLGGLTWTGTECQDMAGNRVVQWHGAHSVLYDTIGAGTYDMAGNVDASNIDTPAGPFGPNAPFGAPAFNSWPTWTTTVHQQVYYKWLERAYIGGLRLMVMMAVNSEAACRTGNHLADVDCRMSMLPPDRLWELDLYDDRFKLCDGTTCPAPDPSDLPLPPLPPIELQLQAAYEFEDWLNAQPGGGWFKIVRTPEESRQAIADGKLAVVLSIEVDHLFNCHATNSGPDYPNGDPRPPCTEADVQIAIDKYYDKGVRHVFPVHNFDNAFAGAATWINSLNIANRAMEGHWWEVEECPPGNASLAPAADDGYALKVSLGLVENLLAVIGFPEFDFFCSDEVFDYYLECTLDQTLSCDNPPADPPGCTSLIFEQQPLYADNGQTNSCNQRGLTSDEMYSDNRPEPLGMTPGLGAFLIDALMDKGMLIDIDHMSIRSLNSTLTRAEARDYPLLASHGQFFELQKKFYTEPEAREGRHERLRTREQLERLGDLGSLVAVMLKDDAQPDFLRTKQTLPYSSTTGMPEIRDDCRHSTKSWAQAYQYAVDVLGGPVAVGSDWNGVAQHLGPRFGNQGCGGSATVIIGDFDPDDGGEGQSRADERSAQEKTGDQLQYPFSLPGFGTFDKQVTGQKTFDFNYDGLAHVGMMPDMLGDLLQIGLREEDLNPLMQSAEAYVTLWEKADFIALNSDDLGPTAPAECVNRTFPIGPNCSAVDVSIAVDSLFGNPDVTLTQSPAGPYFEGTHQVTLTVGRNNSLTCEATDFCAATITVTADPSQCVLTADAGGPYTTPEGQPVTVDGSNSFDPPPVNGPLGYAWDLDGDGDFDDATGVTASFTNIGDDGVFNIGLQVTNFDGDMASDTSTVTVTNVAPSGLTLSATTVDENGATSLTGSFTDPGTLDTFELDIDWGDPLSPGNTQTLALGTDLSFSVNHQYLDDNPGGTASDDYTISVMVTDDDNGSTSNTEMLSVHNLNPVVAAPATSPEPSDEGSAVTASATFTDSGSLDTHQCSVDYGDGSGEQVASVLNGVCTGPAHTYLDNGSYPVTVRVSDDDTGVGSNNSLHQVNNAAPSNLVISASTINENGRSTLSGSFTDPGTLDTFQIDINWGDPLSPANAETYNFGTADSNSPGVSWTAATRSFVIEHQYLDDNPTGTAGDNYSISVVVTDNDSGTVNNSTSVNVNNLDPVATINALRDQLTGLDIAYLHDGATPVPGDIDVVLVGTAVELEGSYTDVGSLDTHSGIINWGDGTGNAAIGLVPAGSNGSTDTASHAYATDLAPGDYVIDLIMTDDDTGADTATAGILIVDAEGALEDALADIQDLIDGGGLDPAAEMALREALYRLSGNPGDDDDGDGDGDDENGALDHLERGLLNPGLIKIQQAIEYLQDAEAADAGLNMTSAKVQLTLTARSIVAGAISDASAIANKNNQLRKIESAEALMADGDADLASGDYLAALADYIDAVRQIASMIGG